MNQIRGSWGWQLLASAVIVGGVATSGNCALGQVVEDTTLGAESSRVTSPIPGGFLINGGATRGTNLFHSFQEFSIPTNGIAFFNNALTIQNIISRVTGVSVSNIDGTIRANGTANLFLINPNGIVFGPNASLNIGGSFFASTARGVVFDNGFEFSATNPQAPPLLTINVPLGLQYGSNAGTIQAQRSRLRVRDGKTLALVGGNVQLDGAGLFALGGRVELAGVGDTGTVGLSGNGNNLSLSLADGVLRSDVSLTNGATVDVRAGGGGSIAVNARSLNLAGGSALRAGIASGRGSIDTQAGDIEITAIEAISLTDGSVAYNLVAETAQGKAGSVNITTGSLFLTNGAQLSASTFGRGDAGNVNITASDSVSFHGVGSNGLPSAAFSMVAEKAVGNGGSINITTGSLSLTNGARLVASTFGRGDAGSVNITASDSVSFDGVSSNGFFSGAASTVEQTAEGKGGSVNITTASLSLTNGAQLQALTRGRGDAGSVTITARDTVSFDGVGSNGLASAALSTVEEATAVGKGGSVNITTGSLSLTNGAQLQASTFGRGDAGSVNITARDTVSFDGVGSSGLPSGAFSLVTKIAEGKAGDINITTGSLSVTNGARLTAATLGQGDAGSVNITARDTVSFDGVGSNGWFSAALSTVEQGAVGKGGSINITTGSLSLTNGAQLQALTRGRGDAGSVNITARETVSLDGVSSNGFSSAAFSTVERTGVGKGGSVNITTGSLNLTNGAQLAATTRGQGDAGSVNIFARESVFFDGVGSNGLPSGAFSLVTQTAEGNGGSINITTDSLRVTNGAQLSAGTYGRGDAGSVNIFARESVSFDGVSSNGYLSAALSTVELNAVGKGGNVNITTGSLSVTNGAQLQAGTRGRGDAGSVNINASDSVSFDGVSSNGLSSAAFSTVEATAVGKGGGINITTGSLSVTNGASLVASTRGQGDAGSVNINANDSVSFDGVGSNGFSSGAFSTVEATAVGKGGGINITTGSLSVTNGAALVASTRGQGDAGSVNINASDSVSFDGVGGNGEPSGAFSAVAEKAEGKGGSINITTDSLSVTNGARLSAATFGRGDAGSVNIIARDRASFDGVSSNGYISAAFSTVEQTGVGKGGSINISTGSLSLTNGAQLQAGTRGRGDAGSVNIVARDTVSFDGVGSTGFRSGAFSTVQDIAVGNGGSVNITTDSLSLTNGGAIATTSFVRQGNAGDINITARDLVLNDKATIQARTASGNGGNMTLNVQDLLLMRRNSLISTTAGEAGQGGDGGNMNINAQFIVAVPKEDSDITANAYTGRGGNINITTQGIYGLQFRPRLTPLSDITASSQLGVDGTVQVNGPDVDPSRGLAELPTEVVDASEQIDRRCTPAGRTGDRSSFTITGRGGLPPSPNDVLQGESVITNWVTLDPQEDNRSSNVTSVATTAPQTPTITEAQSWRYGSNGEVILTADASNIAPDNPMLTPVKCDQE